MLLIAVVGAVLAWLGLDDVNRYVWAAVAISAGLALSLTTLNDL